MAFFKCNHFGIVLEVVTDHDIEGMRKHSDYSEVDKAAFDAYHNKTDAKAAKAKKPDSSE